MKGDVICIFCKRYMGILLSRHFDVRMTSYKHFLLILDLESKNTPYTKSEQDQPISWQKCKFLHFSVLRHIHNKKVAMATPKINENCYYVQNDSHRCKIKLDKFRFDILYRFGVIKESLPGDGFRPSHQVK